MSGTWRSFGFALAALSLLLSACGGGAAAPAATAVPPALTISSHTEISTPAPAALRPATCSARPARSTPVTCHPCRAR